MVEQQSETISTRNASHASTPGDPQISVVIPSYDPGEDIKRCLHSVLAQQTSVSYEVIVVDSSEKDCTETWEQTFHSVRFIHLTQRAFPGTARNLGARKAVGEYVTFTDTDCVVDAHWVQEIWQAHQRGYHVVGGSVANGTPDSYVGTAEYLLEFNEINPWMPGREVQILPSCNLSVRKKLFEKCGYLEDAEKGSDTLFCVKVTSHGFKIYFTPKAIVTHHNRCVPKKYLNNQRALGRGSAGIRMKTDRPGAVLTKLPFLIPIIPGLRSLAIAKRLLGSRLGLFGKFCWHYPLILAGLWTYTSGFWEGYKKDKQSNSGVLK